MPISLTLDLEDHRSHANQPPRFAASTQRFLEFAGELGVRATVFVVGELAMENPELIRDVAAAGHEVGVHGWRHISLRAVGRGVLKEELMRARALLEDITGAPVSGMRAPMFSLTPGDAWAVEEIRQAGFAYSSSVLPSASPLNGWPGAPRHAFRWPNGLVELPCAVIGLGPLSIPFLGGVYLRYLPLSLIARATRSVSIAPTWSYLHPYELDPEEEFFVLPWAGWLTSRIVLGRRRQTLARLQCVLSAGGGAGPPLEEIAAASAQAPVFASS